MSLTQRKTLVFGPAYLDRVVKVDRPLIVGGVIDRSVLGEWQGEASPGVIRVVGLAEGDLEIQLPADWPGPTGRIRVNGGADGSAPARALRCLAWHDDLGGMGAGYAKALSGTLCCPLGDPSDEATRRVAALLEKEGIAHRPAYHPSKAADWTLLISSGEFGDKLPIGFRDPVRAPFPIARETCDLLVVTSMTNARIAAALAAIEAGVRFFAPAMRNMTDLFPTVLSLSRHIDILCCNRIEWENLTDREEVAWRLSILAVTDGPRGAEIRYTTPQGDAGRLEIPAFPRRHPPRDTNRAGEAFASTLVTNLLDAGWTPGTTEDALIQHAAQRASAAAALVLDRVDFGFPTAQEIDEAIQAGQV